MEEFLKSCADSVSGFKGKEAERLAREAIQKDFSVMEVIDKGFVAGIRRVGRMWEDGEIFLPELVMGAEAMKKAMAVLQPELGADHSDGQGAHVVIGTIEGDIHDIGKTLVATMLSANGFRVTDLGADVPVEAFLEEVEKGGVDCLAVSALLTTTMPGQKRLIEEMKARRVKDRPRVMVGGAPCSRKWADEIGADGYAGDAVEAVSMARKLVV